MGTWYYEVVSIDGDYANLRRTDIPSEDLKLVARALLPAEIMEGSRLKYELMQYEIVEASGRLRSDDRCGAGARDAKVLFAADELTGLIWAVALQ